MGLGTLNERNGTGTSVEEVAVAVEHGTAVKLKRRKCPPGATSMRHSMMMR